MSIFVMCSVRDNAVQAFMAPFCARSENDAIRAFTDACADQNLPFVRHPDDYVLYVVGEWDDARGMMVELQQNKMLCTAADCLPKSVRYVDKS